MIVWVLAPTTHGQRERARTTYPLPTQTFSTGMSSRKRSSLSPSHVGFYHLSSIFVQIVSP